jgi:hypothetical protein
MVETCCSVADHEPVAGVVDGVAAGADAGSRTDVISPSETESFPTSSVGPPEVIEKPLTMPVTGRPEALLPETVSPIRLAAAEVWSVVATCSSVCTWEREASCVKKSALLVGSNGSWYLRLSTRRLRNSFGSRRPLLLEAMLDVAALVEADGVAGVVAGMVIEIS